MTLRLPRAYKPIDGSLLQVVLAALDLINGHGADALTTLQANEHGSTATGEGMDVLLQNHGCYRILGSNDATMGAILSAWYTTERPNVKAIGDVLEAYLGYRPVITDGYDGGTGPGQRIIQITFTGGIPSAPNYAMYAWAGTGSAAWTDFPWSADSFSTWDRMDGESGIAGCDYAWGTIPGPMFDFLNDMIIAGWRLEAVYT